MDILHCKEKLLYIAVFLFFSVSMVLNSFREWMDFFMLGLAIHAFLNPYFCEEKKILDE